jgi:hypothetical protein
LFLNMALRHMRLDALSDTHEDTNLRGRAEGLRFVLTLDRIGIRIPGGSTHLSIAADAVASIIEQAAAGSADSMCTTSLERKNTCGQLIISARKCAAPSSQLGISAARLTRRHLSQATDSSPDVSN